MSAAGYAAAGVASGVLGNIGRRSSAKSAQQFSEKAFKNRYQWAAEDMKAAGLNPMLMTSQGAGAAPQGQKADVQNVGDQIPANAMANASINKIKQDESTAKSQEALNLATAKKVEADAGLAEEQRPWETRKYALLNNVADGFIKLLSNWQGSTMPSSAKELGSLISGTPKEKPPKKQKPSIKGSPTKGDPNEQLHPDSWKQLYSETFRGKGSHEPKPSYLKKVNKK